MDFHSKFEKSIRMKIVLKNFSLNDSNFLFQNFSFLQSKASEIFSSRDNSIIIIHRQPYGSPKKTFPVFRKLCRHLVSLRNLFYTNKKQFFSLTKSMDRETSLCDHVMLIHVINKQMKSSHKFCWENALKNYEKLHLVLLIY